MNIFGAILTGRLKLAPAPATKRKPRRALKKPKLWRWGIDGLWSAPTTQVHTKSEARAHFKRDLGLPASGRLPIGANICLIEK